MGSRHQLPAVLTSAQAWNANGTVRRAIEIRDGARRALSCRHRDLWR
ncbi:MAG TPA: hypothetical protein VGQ26_26690 [Streptosporangiaceae bacterium]|nr:hypothetical protein [Streptosporangiaceae bacterium]